MRNLFVILFLIVIQYVMVAEKYHTYNLELVATLPVGEGEGELKVEYAPDPNPSAFAFDKNGNLYISDLMIGKLVKYNPQFKYEKEFYDGYSGGARQLFINENGEFLIYNATTFAVDDSNGNKKIQINLYESKYRDKISGDPSFVYYDNIVFANLSDGSIISIPEPEKDKEKNKDKILGSEKTKQYIEDKANQNKFRNFNLSISGTNGNDKQMNVQNDIIIDGNIETRDFRKYYNHIKTKKKDKSKTDSKSNNFLSDLFSSKIDINPDTFISNNRDLHYLGKDQNKNVYWKDVDLVVIFNNEGELLDAFKFKQKKIHMLIPPTIHPSGDVYYLYYDDNNVYLYRIKRVW